MSCKIRNRDETILKYVNGDHDNIRKLISMKIIGKDNEGVISNCEVQNHFYNETFF